MTIAAADAISVRDFMNLAKASTTKEPLSASTRPAGSSQTAMSATAMRASAPMFIRSADRSPRNAPNRTRVSTPIARMISGSAGPSTGDESAGVILTSVSGQHCRFHGRQCCLIVRHERVRRRRETVENRAGMRAVIHDEENERSQDHDLAPVEILDALQGRLVEDAVHHAAIEPQGGDCREHHGCDRDERDERIGAERSHEAQKLADEARCAGKA